MATLGFLNVVPEECRAVWTVARADVEAAGDGGLACNEFCLLGHTWSLQIYPDADSTTAQKYPGAAITAPCSIMVGSREKGEVQASITLNGVAQTLNHVFGSGAREILRWPGTGAVGSDSVPMALEVVLQISSVGEDASERAAGERSLVQQLASLKAERTELQVRVAALSDELQAVGDSLIVSEKGRTASEQQVAELSTLLSAMQSKAAQLEEAAQKCKPLEASLAEQRAENERLTSERTKLQEDLRDLRDDHETLTKRFSFAQELKAKAEVMAYQAETEKASLQDLFDKKVGELQATIEAVQLEKRSLEVEVEKLQPVAGWAEEKQRLEDRVAKLEAEKDAEIRILQAEKDALQNRTQDLERKRSELQSKVDQYQKKKAGLFG